MDSHGKGKSHYENAVAAHGNLAGRDDGIFKRNRCRLREGKGLYV